jgi:hypothetical protein
MPPLNGYNAVCKTYPLVLIIADPFLAEVEKMRTILHDAQTISIRV